MKKSLILTLLVSAPSITYAAEIQKPVPQVPSEYRIILTPPQLAVLAGALQQLPYRDVAELLNNLEQQRESQLIPPPSEPTSKMSSPPPMSPKTTPTPSKPTIPTPPSANKK